MDNFAVQDKEVWQPTYSLDEALEFLLPGEQESDISAPSIHSSPGSLPLAAFSVLSELLLLTSPFQRWRDSYSVDVGFPKPNMITFSGVKPGGCAALASPSAQVNAALTLCAASAISAVRIANWQSQILQDLWL